MSSASTLIILAAGMGSRFGGPKQIAGVGPSGETLLEYGLYDAFKAGFNRFVFVIRESIRSDFESSVLARFAHRLDCACVLQSIDDLPGEINREVSACRQKPWGTGHALWTARNAVDGPCAVMNADDYYGPASFRILIQALNLGASSCLVPFRLDQTLSGEGGVSRGVCHMDSDNTLERIQECRDLVLSEGDVVMGKDNASLLPVSLSVDTPVSMNLMGFSQDVWPFIEEHIYTFFAELESSAATPEYGLPDILTGWIARGEVMVKQSPESWIGMTHASDLQAVRQKIANLIESGAYPESLWG